MALSASACDGNDIMHGDGGVLCDDGGLGEGDGAIKNAVVSTFCDDDGV